MGPRKYGFWLPLVRLSAFFVAVVVGGNLLFHAAQPSLPPLPAAPVDTVDYFNKKKRKIERHLRAIERFFTGDEEEATSAPTGMEPAVPPTVACSAPVEAVPASPSAPVEIGLLAYVEPEIAPYQWPGQLDPIPVRELDLPRSMSEFGEPIATPEFVCRFMRRSGFECVSDFGDLLLGGPELLFDGVLALAGQMLPRPDVRVLGEDEGSSITERIFEVSVEQRRGRIFSEFLELLVEREQRYFARFEESTLSTVAVDDGSEDVDTDELMRTQRKIVWDALRKTYFSKYKVRAEERIRDEAFYFNQWRGVDFVVLPPLVGAYLWYRGLDKRFSMGETWLRVSVEPLSEWMSKREDMIAGLSVEWMIKGFPVGLIVSAGLYEGDVELDFVGIGTSVGAARKALAMHHGDPRRD